MIIHDTETSGLPLTGQANMDKQPYILEFYGVKIHDETFEVLDEYHSYYSVPIPISPEITNINGISNDTLIGKPSFAHELPRLTKFFLGEKILCAHNLEFDKKMLRIELKRQNKSFNFPWPIFDICTMEKSHSIEGKNIKMARLYELATGLKLENAHRAKNDVMALIEGFKYLVKEGYIDMGLYKL